jgi:hypothetical protein
MSNKLEQFIQEHRIEFNNDRPSANIWDEIEATLPKKKVAKVVTINTLYKWMAAAAVVCIVLTSVYFVYFNEKIDNPVSSQQRIQNLSPEYASQLNRGVEMIQTRQQELKAATVDNPELYQAFLSDLQVLDSTYKILQKQAASTPNRDVIIKAMMQNLQLQAELLYRQLLITNEFKKETSKTNDAELKQQNPS